MIMFRIWRLEMSSWMRNSFVKYRQLIDASRSTNPNVLLEYDMPIVFLTSFN